MTENEIYSDDRLPAPPLQKRLYLLGFKAGVAFDLVAYPVFWWELHQHNADAAAALNYDVSAALFAQVKI